MPPLNSIPWRSREDPPVEERTDEFPDGASEWPEQFSRRAFLRLAGASFAAAGMAACSRQPIEKLVPYVRQPEDCIPGLPRFYASTVLLDGIGRGVLVESHEGRPTKIEGNPQHPASLGGTDALMQAAILQLYDPDRSKIVTCRGSPAPWMQFLGALAAEEKKWGAGEGLAFICGGLTSPTARAQIARIASRYPRAQWAVDAPARNFSAPRLVADFGKADVIVALDADFLGGGPAMPAHVRAFQARRDPSRTMNRLYVIEPVPSLTGAMADHRFALRPSEMASLLAQLETVLAGGRVSGAPTWLAAVASDLQKHHGLIVVGEYLPLEIHLAAQRLNGRLGNGARYAESPLGFTGTHSLAEVCAALNEGRVQAAFILGANPAYDAPADVPVGEALRRVPFSVHHGLYDDETAFLCQWHLPALHTLEGWSDALAFEGTASIVQPLIEPLYDGVSLHTLLEALAGGGARSDYEIVRDFWRQQTPALDFDQALRDGVIAAKIPRTSGEKLPPPPAASAVTSGLELIIRPDPHVHDGTFSNNAWLQELPKPLTKLVWDNAAAISPATARRLGVEHGDVVELSFRGRSLRAPVWVLPGMADECVQATLGYGRTRAGAVGNGVGFNASLLRPLDAPWGGHGLEVRRTDAKHLFATTQEHGSMEERHPVRCATLAEFARRPDFAREDEPDPGASLYPAVPYDGYAWGMAIDLNTCVGCSACTIACQAENNIPVVGAAQVRAGREMHWIRVDRYFSGGEDAPAIHHQPVPCMHCENAPCELVCPVAATVHDHEGLNAMVYNRCIGTRYCSNNCPYKVRRFNFLSYVDTASPTLKLQRNPNVTVRCRGVMEKCTYCVQRINAARIHAQNERRAIRDGEIVPACVQACPAGAITFGNINDASAQVSRQKASPRNYGLLAELNTRPRTTYLARITNPNPEIPPA